MIPLAPLLLKLSALKPLLQKYWKEMIVVGMAFMLWYQNFSETRFLLWIETIPSLEARLETREAAFKLCQEGNEKLSSAIDERNHQIDAWREISEQHEKDIKGLERDLAEVRKKTTAKVTDILTDPTPQTCDEAIQYLRDGTEDVKW